MTCCDEGQLHSGSPIRPQPTRDLRGLSVRLRTQRLRRTRLRHFAVHWRRGPAVIDRRALRGRLEGDPGVRFSRAGLVPRARRQDGSEYCAGVCRQPRPTAVSVLGRNSVSSSETSAVRRGIQVSSFASLCCSSIMLRHNHAHPSWMCRRIARRVAGAAVAAPSVSQAYRSSIPSFCR